MLHTKAEILLNQNITSNYFKLVLRLDNFKGHIRAGQFFHIRAGSDYDPLLRRPISLHRVGDSPNIIEMIYRVVGKGTQLMSRRSKGTNLDLIGPIGNGFRISKTQSNFIIVGGGMGIAPLMALCDDLARYRKGNINVILAAKTADDIICEREFRELKANVMLVTEDGSRGMKGLATDALEQVVKLFDLRERTSPLADQDTSGVVIGDYNPQVGVYTCGCKPMLYEIAKICRRYKLKAQGSFEERMGCGLGACLGCVLETVKGYKRVCKDGPVFELADIVF